MKSETCPFCHNKLIHGYIRVNGEILIWTSNPKRKPLLTYRWSVKENEIQLGKYTFFGGGVVDAFRCENCGKIIIDSMEKNKY